MNEKRKLFRAKSVNEAQQIITILLWQQYIAQFYFYQKSILKTL